MNNKEICNRCGKEVNGYLVLIRNEIWVCNQCFKNIESHG